MGTAGVAALARRVESAGRLERGQRRGQRSPPVLFHFTARPMRTVLITLRSLACAGPLAAQSAADTAAIRAVALRASPPKDAARHEVASLVIRGDTADVTVSLERGDTVERQQRLTLVRNGDQWVALPRRSIVLLHVDKL